MFGRGSTPLFEPQESGQYERAIKQDRSGIHLDRKHDLARNRAAGGSVAPQMPNEAPPAPMVRLKRQMRCRRRQWCASNAKWSAAIANVAPSNAKWAQQSQTLPVKRQMGCSNPKCCALNTTWGAAIVNVARQTPHGAQQSQTSRLKRHIGRSNPKCCASNPK